MTFNGEREATDQFCLPVDLSRLENDKLRLVPVEHDYGTFVRDYIEHTKQYPEVFKYLPYGPFEDAAAYSTFYPRRLVNPASQMFAIRLKAGTIKRKDAGADTLTELVVPDNAFAGTVALINSSLDDSMTEIGHVVILPPYQRTFVATTVNCLLLQHALNPQPTDLGLRRVQWMAHSQNAPSIAAAERLGFKREGTLRWYKALPIGKNGHDEPEMPRTNSTETPLGPGRHTAVLSLCWDDWQDGGREHVDQLLTKYSR